MTSRRSLLVDVFIIALATASNTAGCKHGSDASDGGTDGGIDSGGTQDAASDDAGPPCGPWSDPVPVVELNSADDEADPYVAGDGLTIYFTRGALGGDLDIYLATRTTPAGAWGMPTVVAGGVNGPWNDRNPSVSADGLRMYFDADDSGGFKLYVSSRADVGVPFGARVLIAGGVNDLVDAFSPTLPTDEGVLVFSSTESGNPDLWTSATNGADMFGVGVPLAELNTTTGDGAPWLSADGLELYFASIRPGAGADDVYLATRLTASAPFSAPMSLAFNSSAREDDPARSPDGHELYFMSTRVGGTGGNDLWMTTRQCQ